MAQYQAPLFIVDAVSSLPSGAATEGLFGYVQANSTYYTFNGTSWVPFVSQVEFADSPSIDAFSRVRTSAPANLFDCQFTYDLKPLLFEPLTTGIGSTVTYDGTNRNALLTVLTANPAAASMQSYECFRYQPGKSQQIFITFNFIETKANTTRFVGYSDGSNGIELQASGTTIRFALLSDTTNGDQTVNQASWNLDTMNGSGASGITLDFTKAQILVIDFQALYTGRVRVGFDVGGSIIYAHEFLHANSIAYPYIQSANLPIRAGITGVSTGTTMRFICCTVVSEGGQEDTTGFRFSAEGTVTASSGARTHILSVRPNTTFNSIANRAKFVLESFNLVVTGGTNQVLWELCLGQAISGTTAFTDVNATYSTMEYNTAGTISGSPTIVIASGYCAAGAANGAIFSTQIQNSYPITLDAAGAVRALGTLSVIVTGIGGTAATRCVMNWKEIR